MTTKKVIKKIAIILVATFVLLVTTSVVGTYYYKDELINHFIEEANKSLNTPIKIEKISVSALDNFPSVTLKFNNVYIEESFEGSSDPLIKAKQIEFTFNFIEIINGIYTVEQINIIDSKCHFKVNRNGDTNYNILKKQETSNGKKVKLDLSKVSLESIDFKYSNYKNELYLYILANKAKANVGIEGQVYEIESDGDFVVNKILTHETMILENKNIKVSTALVYNDSSKNIVFNESLLTVKESDFITQGNYNFLEIPTVDFSLAGKDTDIQTIISLLPEENTKQLSKYKSTGGVYFDLTLQGDITDESAPKLDVNFGLTNAQLLYPEKNVKITDANAKGKFTANNIVEISKGELTLNDISGKLEGKYFTSNLYIRNFKDSYIKLDFDGLVDVNSLIEFTGTKEITNTEGNLQINLSMEGHTRDLKNKETTNKMKTAGQVNITELSFRHADISQPFKNINGNLLFNNSDLALSDVSGYYGQSDFLLNGYFKNIIAFILFKNEPVGIEADLKSDFINLDELLSVNSSSSINSSDYSFSISPRLLVNFNCQVNRLKFRRFKPKNIRGDLKVKNQIAYSNKVKFDAMGGTVTVGGKVDAKIKNEIDINTDFSINRVNIDSIFYVFENFNQDFLEDRHLKGQILAEVQAKMQLNQKLHLKPESLTATINTNIIGGQLNNFEPMQKLAKYIDEDKLDHLEFSDLRNEIHVENTIIYLPEMEVSSNVTDIKISGTHTFDQKINYRVIAPLRSKKKIDSDEAFGAIEIDNEGRSMLFLKIIGTTSDYKIAYDKEGVRQKINQDLKKEVKELKEAFKNKGLDKQKTVELEEDDYFEWSDDGK